MIRKLFLVIVMNAFVAHAGRCQTMSMDECMAYAVEHAAEVGRQQYHLANAPLGNIAALWLRSSPRCRQVWRVPPTLVAP